MKKEKENKKCWACGKDILATSTINVCSPSHRKLFMKSASGETVEEVLARKPQYKKYL